MYDSNYFKKIIGENVDPNNYFERTTNSLIIDNDNTQVNSISTKNINNSVQANNMYPDTYKIIMPMIEEAVKRRSGQNITEQFIQDVTNEVFTAIEVESNINKNKVLYDLIQILVINFLANNFSITQTTSIAPYPEDY